MKIKKPVVRILVGAAVGLIAGVGVEYAGLWVLFPFFSILGLSLGIFVGLIVEAFKYRRFIRHSSLEGKGLDLERLPLSTAEFVKLVAKKMRYRKNVQDDVTAELAAHFEDELRDCKSNEEKSQKAQQLIADFGDVKLLAVLLRRAKKRCRPLWQTVVARTFQAVGILILFFVVYVAWFLTGKPAITTDYLARLNQMVRPAADESLNAAPLYIKATELYGKASDDFLLFFAENYKEIGDPEIGGRFRREGRLRAEELADDIRQLLSTKKETDIAEKTRRRIESEVAQSAIVLLPRRYQETSTIERKFIKKWLKEQKEPLDLLVAGTEKPYYWQKYANKQNTTEMMSVLLPHLSEFRKLTQSLCWLAHLRADQGRHQDAFSNIKSCYRLGQHIKGDNTFLIEQLVGMAIEALAAQRLRDILSEYEIDSTVLTELQKDLEQIITGEDFTVSFEAEKLSMYDVIQRCFTEDRLGGGHLCLQEFKQIVPLIGFGGFEDIIEGRDWTTPLHILFTHPNKQETREMVDRYYAFGNKMAHKTPAQIHSEDIDFEEEFLEMAEGNILLEIFFPAFGRIIELGHRNKTDTEALVTIIALLRYKNDKGLYPENLQELILITTGYSKKVPMDLYSDKPLVYKKTDDSFILYSIGENFKDDGGQIFRDSKGKARTWADEGDAVFWPVPKWTKRLQDRPRERAESQRANR